MMKVTLRLPASLLRRFRELAADLSLYGRKEPIPMHDMLAMAVLERVASGISARLEAPPATLVPFLSVELAVPEWAAHSVARLAGRANLSLEQAWHRVVLEFCERSDAPRLPADLAREAA